MPLCLCWTPTPPGSDGDILGSSFKFFVSYLDAAEKLKPKERGEFLYAVAKFGITGEEIPLRKSLQANINQAFRKERGVLPGDVARTALAAHQAV